jgi:hypothetical protein
MYLILIQLLFLPMSFASAGEALDFSEALTAIMSRSTGVAIQEADLHFCLA